MKKPCILGLVLAFALITLPAMAADSAADGIQPWKDNPRYWQYKGKPKDRSDNEAYLAACPGKAYALYFTDGGSVGLDLSKVPGRYDLRWIDISTGGWGRSETLAGGKSVTIAAPAKGHWGAAIVRAK